MQTNAARAERSVFSGAARRQIVRTLGQFALGVTLLGAAAGCGFALRGATRFKFAFQSIHSGFAPGSAIGQDFKRLATAQGLVVHDGPHDINASQVVLRVHLETREKAVVGTGVAAQVREMQLRVRVRFSLLGAAGKVLLDAVELVQQREMSYNETYALAKEAEEEQIYQDMQQEIVPALLRRLAAVKAL